MSDVNIGRANCCHVVLIKTHDTSCDFVTSKFGVLSLVLDGVIIQHNVIQFELEESIDAVSGET